MKLNIKTFLTTLVLIFSLSGCSSVPKQKNFDHPAALQLWNIENKDVYKKSYIFFSSPSLGGFYLGCNRFNFVWKSNPNLHRISFDNIMSTRMACESNVEEQKDVEKLMVVNKYKILKNKLFLFEDDTLLFTLILHSKSDSFFNIPANSKK